MTKESKPDKTPYLDLDGKLKPTDAKRSNLADGSEATIGKIPILDLCKLFGIGREKIKNDITVIGDDDPDYRRVAPMTDEEIDKTEELWKKIHPFSSAPFKPRRIGVTDDRNSPIISEYDEGQIETFTAWLTGSKKPSDNGKK